jgi:mannose-6-phosphate isomerase-like protein (cupin superfamily)
MGEFIGPDGAHIRELAGRSTGLASHSLAIIAHPAGMATVEHHHTVADEVYYVQSGRGRVRVDEEVVDVAPGDTIIIRPGQRHKLWADKGEDLVLVVTCAPAYLVTEVIWDE